MQNSDDKGSKAHVDYLANYYRWYAFKSKVPSAVYLSLENHPK
jgi:hypothetical protein